LICDGGRTTHALPSIWEHHQIFSVPDRRAKDRLTVVCGPTCMAFDHMARRPMSANIVPGDHLVWMEAGAYHIPWETRFSHGLSTVLWHEGDKIQVARDRESFDAWWGQWKTH
jgi:diaminopimelate decarboxylase